MPILCGSKNDVIENLDSAAINQLQRILEVLKEQKCKLTQAAEFAAVQAADAQRFNRNPKIQLLIDQIYNEIRRISSLQGGKTKPSKSSWKSTGKKVSVKTKGSDGKFHTVQRTAYKNPKYPGELRISKMVSGKKVFVKFAKT